VGCGQGEFVQETTYRYVGYGGDFDEGKPRDFTCIIAGGGLCVLLVLIPLLIWLLQSDTSTREPIDCSRPEFLSEAQRAYCCANYNVACPTSQPQTAAPTPLPTMPTIPPTPPFTTPPPLPTPATTHGKVDPYNCAVAPESTWSEAKRAWCCRIHHLGCRTSHPTVPPPNPDPYNCADGFENWQAGWSFAKKAWCCRHHRKGCGGGGGCGTTSAPYDCNAGFSNWQAGWSMAKKAWCCQHEQKGCGGGGGCGTTKAPYDCAAGFANWQAGWSMPKKAWCCQHEQKGCNNGGGCV